MIKLIIFDWDDVITLGGKEGYFACYDYALQRVGVVLPETLKRERILKKWGKNHIEELKELLLEHPHLIDTAIKEYENAFFGNVFVSSLSTVPGCVETLQGLSKKYSLAVATGGHPTVVKERIMPKFNIPNVFTKIISAYEIDDPEKTKPHPFMLNTIMKFLQSNSDQTVYIGDAENDVKMANAAGVTPVVVLTGHLSKQEAVNLGVKYIIPDVTYLPKVLQKFK